MNHFVFLMLQKEISSEEILTICVNLRTVIFNNLLDSYTNFSTDIESMKRILEILDTNVGGVLTNFENKRIERNTDKQKEKQLKKYLNRLQIILDAQDNVIFKLRDNQLYIANKALYLMTGVADIQSYKKKYASPLEFIKHVNFHDILFKKKEYNQWISKIITEHKGQCKAQIFNHLSNQTSLMKVKITQIGTFDDFVFTLENITEQQNKINRLNSLAYKDALTGLNNLKGFEDFVAKQLSNVSRNNLKILMIELRGLRVYREQHSKIDSDQLLKNIAEPLEEYDSKGSARIDSNRFAILNKTLTLENANELLSKIDKILSLNTVTDNISVRATIILVQDKDTVESLLERGEILLNNIHDYAQAMIVDDAIVAKKEKERLKQQESFLSLMQNYMKEKKTLPVTSYYLEIPLESSAKIMRVTKNGMTLSIRKISALSLSINDSVYIQMPEKPNFKARIRSIAIDKTSVILDNFIAIENSSLDRRNIHVKLKEPIEILIKSKKAQIPEELDMVSITTFVAFVNHLYDIKVDSELKMYVSLLDKEEEFLGSVVKIIPVADRFKLIIHLKPTPSLEKTLIPFVSARQIEIIKELKEKASYL